VYRIRCTIKGGAVNEIIWHSKALGVIKGFSASVKKDLGYLLYRLQAGETLTMPHSRSMRSVGKGCFELRVKSDDVTYRVFYMLKMENKILVFHAFKKKTQKPPKHEIELAKNNLKDLI
jgi:phage-related protein